METLQRPPDAVPAASGSRAASELRGAIRLVQSGIAVRVLLCGLSGRDAVAAVADVADLSDGMPIRTERDAGDTFSVIVGPARS